MPPPPGTRRAKQPQNWSALPPVHIEAPRPTPLPLIAILGMIGSGLVHFVIVLLIIDAALHPKKIEQQTPVEFEVVTKPPPPPPPPPPEPPKEEKKPDPPKVAKVFTPPPPPKEAPPPPKGMPPPPPNEPPPPEAKPQAPVMIGVTMSSTTSAGGFAAPVGNTLYGSAPKVAPKPEEVKPYAAPVTAPPPGGRYVPPYKVTKVPEPVGECKGVYPEEARKLGIEGQVVLRIRVDSTGNVVKAAVVKALGYGFDESAVAAITKCRFKPGTEGDEAIATEITYTFTFLLD
ncbi:MAG: TonB family protein [Myxococcales bacterium]